MSEKAAVKKIFDVQLLRRVLHYAAPYKKKFYLSLALAILGTAQGVRAEEQISDWKGTTVHTGARATRR